MSTWLSIGVVIVVVIVFGMARERMRIGAIEKWAAGRGFAVRSPFVPGPPIPFAALAARFHPRGALRWGLGVEGSLDGVPVVVTEYEASRIGDDRRPYWHALVVLPAADAPVPIVAWCGDRGVAFSDARVAERLGAAAAEPDALRERIEGGGIVEGEPAGRGAWLTEERRRALAGWSRGGEFALTGSSCAWRTEGLLTASRLETLLSGVADARRIFGGRGAAPGQDSKNSVEV